ncbi:MAG: CpaF family protein [Oscillospiraceae bacterium]|nr:CpaF family protein [Oscillospiraceae bacterium]
MDKLAPHIEWSDAEIEEVIDRAVLDAGRRTYLKTAEKIELKRDIFNSIRRLDLLQELIEDDEITEIMVNGTESIFYEKGGALYRWHKKFDEEERLLDVIQQIVGRSNRRVNQASPIVDTHLPDGSRVNAVLKPAAVNGPILTIRKFYKDPITLEKLIAWGSVTEKAADVLKLLVRAGYNIFISGSTGSGKTTFLNALAHYIPEDERVITIEDSAELKIAGIENLVSLEVRNAGADGSSEITIRDLIRTSLRMRPDRIIVGEVRGPEAIDMLQAMNTGHDGSLSTGHANSVEDMLARLEVMILWGMNVPVDAVRKQITSAIDIVIQLGRMRDKSRKVTDIVELAGYENGRIVLNELYAFDGEKLRATGNKLLSRKKLEREAVVTDEI